MEMEEAIGLVKRLVDNIACWQHAAERGRSAETRKKIGEVDVRKVLAELTGTVPSDEQINEVLANVGTV